MSFDEDDHGTVVIEGGVIPRRVRRPADLLRMAIALEGPDSDSAAVIEAIRRAPVLPEAIR